MRGLILKICGIFQCFEGLLGVLQDFFGDFEPKAKLSSLITSATPRSDQITFHFTVSRSAESKKSFIIIAQL
jgi:hypothetical protein